VLQPGDVYARLEMLLGADLSRRMFGAERHRYLLTPAWSEDRIRGFENRHHVTLPEEYRYFLRWVGAAGAGPGYGLYEPGTWDDEPRNWENTRRVGALARPFPHTARWNLPRERLAALTAGLDDDLAEQEYWAPEITCGAMPIASLGGGTQALLVVSGPQRGKIWIDDRVHENGLAPDDDLDFDGWYSAWLQSAEQVVLSPPRRRITGRRGDRPARTVQLEGAAAEAAARLRERVHVGLAAGRTLELGGLGKFCHGPHPHFEQGLELRDAIAINAPPPHDSGSGDADVVFHAVFERVMQGLAVELPGLFTAWRAAATGWEHHDYLGRRRYVEEPRLLVIVDDPGLPKCG
jgi:hypothetical protein